MSEGKKCKMHTAKFKAKVGLEAVRGEDHRRDRAAYRAHPVLVGQWKKGILEHADTPWPATLPDLTGGSAWKIGARPSGPTIRAWKNCCSAIAPAIFRRR